ncbi:ABC transporter substrate-binding protein [Agrococcus sp. ProA11]|uniref:ABC transporter substrate-binding protein n=1 Tax=Agrococcus chionoecetis TaxID=3153752 RepID=UPI003260B461
MAWTGELTSVNAASTQGATSGNRDVAAMTRGAFAVIDDAGEVREDPTFGTATIIDESPFTVRYDLADGVRWSDGVPVDAADLMLGWAAASNALSTRDLAIDALRGVDGALDLPEDAVWFDVADAGGMQHASAAVRDDWARSVDVEFSQPIPEWRLALEVAVPAHLLGQRVLGIADPMEAKQALLDALDRADPLVLGQVAAAWSSLTIDPLAPDAELLLSSGPYRVEAMQHGRVELVANDAYVGAQGAAIERIALQPVADDRAALAGLTAGELDVATIARTDADSAQLRDLERDDAALVSHSFGVRWELALRADRAPLQSVEARTSLLQSVDRRGAIEAAHGEGGQDAAATTDSMLFRADTRVYGYALEDAGFGERFGDTDPEAAAMLRESMAIASGTEICVRFDRAEAFAAAFVAAMRAPAAEAGWAVRDCGVDDLVAGLEQDDWNAVLHMTPVPSDVAEISERWRGGGITAAASPERDALLDEALATADQDALEETLLELETSLVADALLLPIVEPERLTIARADVRGVTPRPGPAALTWNAWEWSIDAATPAP